MACAGETTRSTWCVCCSLPPSSSRTPDRSEVSAPIRSSAGADWGPGVLRASLRSRDTSSAVPTRLPWKEFVVSRMLRIYPATGSRCWRWGGLRPLSRPSSPAPGLMLGRPGVRAGQPSGTRAVRVRRCVGPCGSPEAWERSLWTLSPEMVCYAVAGVALTFAIVRRRTVLISSIALVAVTVSSLLLESTHHLFGGPRDLLHLMAFFTAGALAWALRDRIAVRASFAAAALATSVAWAWLTQPTRSHRCHWRTSVLALGSIPRPWFRTRAGPLIRAVHLQLAIQTMLYLVGAARLGWAAYCALTFAIAIPVAYASWNCVEKRR